MRIKIPDFLTTCIGIHLLLVVHLTYPQSNNERNEAFEGRSTFLNNSASKNLQLGNHALDEGNYDLAIDYYDASLYKNHLLTEAYYARAMAKEWKGLQKAALTDYNILLELVPEHKEGIMARAILRYNLEQFNLAFEDFEKFLTLPNGETTAVFFRSSLFESGTDKIITAQGASAEIYNYMGLSKTGLGAFNEAIIYFNKAIQLNPNASDYIVNRGIVFEKLGDKIKAIKDYQLALRVDPDNALASYNLGSLATAAGENQLALQTYSEAISKDPTLAYAYTERAFTKLQMNDLQGALIDYDSALVLDPHDPENWYNRGLVKSRVEDYESAINDFNMAIDLEPAYENAYLSRANTLIKMDEYQAAMDNYKLAIFYYPGFALAYYNRAIARYNHDDADGACKDLQTAISLNFEIAHSTFNKICK